MKKVVLSLVLILLFSGCTGMPDIFKGIIPGVGEQVNKTELSPDLIVIQNLNVIPNPPINAGDQFSVSFEIKNQDEINEVSTFYSLFDTGLCQPIGGDATNEPLGKLAPQQTEFKEWTFSAPKSDEIAYLPTKCPIRFKVNYSFEARSQIDVNIISKERLTQLQRTGAQPTFTPSLTVGRGPIKIYLSFGAQLPARNESSLPIYITVEDKGNGLLKEIPEHKLKLKVHKDFTLSDCEKFELESSGDYNIYRNKDKIPIIKKKTSQIRCSFTTPSSDAINNLEKTYFITASLEYDYEIIGETSVDVKPTAQ
ncbi:MAG: hypothetical protein QXD43_00485 [Candidatus Aenigmatarchaeota archaeon]